MKVLSVLHARPSSRIPGLIRRQLIRPLTSSGGRVSHNTAARIGYGLGVSLAAILSSVILFKPTFALDSVEDRIIDVSELAKHSSPTSAWVAIDGVVYDVTNWLRQHPAGAQILLDNAGTDISILFRTVHSPNTLEKVLPHIQKIGTLGPHTNATSPIGTIDPVEARRAALFPPEMLINCGELKDLAKEVLGEESAAWSSIYSWADDGVSFADVRSSFSFIRFLPRVNIPVREVDSSATFLGSQSSPLPIFMSPTGGSGLAHPDGEFNATRASAKTGIPQCVSSAASKGVFGVLDERDRIMAAGGTTAQVWLQLYIMTDRKQTEKALVEAARRGVGAILVTVDVPAIGNREAHARAARDQSVRSGAIGRSAKLEQHHALAVANMFEQNLSWDDIAWVRKFAPNIPVLVKGVGSVDDVALAKKYGADGVVLSNHGARQLEGSTPPMATLVRLRQTAPELLEDPNFDVFVDGGVKRGTDVLKALCLGAKGVGLGRTMLYAQACYGEQGILRVCEIMKEEIQRGMRLLGAKTIKDLRPEMVEVLNGLVGEQMQSRDRL